MSICCLKLMLLLYTEGWSAQCYPFNFDVNLAYGVL